MTGARLISYAPAFIRRWQAKRLQMFWMACPECGAMFGGFEAHEPVHYNDRRGRKAVCYRHETERI